MPVAFDAKATTVTHQTAASSPITNTTLTVGASATLVIGVFTAASSASGQAAVTAMTWNGVAMTLISNIASSDGLSDIYVYAIVSPATGNQTCSCSYTANSSAVFDLDCFSFTGTSTASVAACIPSANVATDASTPTSTGYPATAWSVTTVSGDAVVAVVNTDQGGDSAGAIGTLINHEGSSNVNYTSIYNLATSTTTSAQFTATITNEPFCGIVFRITQGINFTLTPMRLIMM